MIYRCIKAFSVSKFDEWDCIDETHSFYVRKGSKWEKSEEKKYDEEVTLYHCKNSGYLCINEKILNEYFEEVKDNE